MLDVFQIEDYNKHGWNPVKLVKQQLIDLLQGEICATCFTC